MLKACYKKHNIYLIMIYFLYYITIRNNNGKQDCTLTIAALNNVTTLFVQKLKLDI